MTPTPSTGLPETAPSWHTIIVGAGLAGVTLAWRLHWAGRRVLLLDADEAVTASKIAAGLITPITGQQLALSRNIAVYLPEALAFYARVESGTGQRVLAPQTAIRTLTTAREQRVWPQRLSDPAIQAHLCTPQPAEHDHFAMHAWQLDVPGYLAASCQMLPFERARIDWLRDVSFIADGITVRGHWTRHLISCEGFAAAANPHFSSIPFTAAKGEILTVQFDRIMPRQCTHHQGLWLAPTLADDTFRVGATYDRETLDNVPTAAGRAELEQKLRGLTDVPFAVVGHDAAVRPVIRTSRPVIGMHPDMPGLGYFNGLGSKGSLLAPWYSARLADLIVHGKPVPDDADIAAYF